MAGADQTYQDLYLLSPSHLNEVVCQLLGLSQASRSYDPWRLRVEHEFGSEERRKTQVSTDWQSKIVKVETGEVEEIAHALQCPAFPNVSLEITVRDNLTSAWDDELLAHMDSISSVLASSPFQSLSLMYFLTGDVQKSSQSFGLTLQALSKNSSLKELRLRVYVRRLDGSAEWRRRPQVLTIEEDGPSSALIQHLVHNQSCTLPALFLYYWRFTDPKLSNLASALATNTTPPTLHTLQICFDEHDSSDPAKPVLAVIKALESNNTITSLAIRNPSLTFPSAKDSQKVYEALIDLLSVNFTLKHLDLDESGLEENGEWMSTITGMLQSSQDPKAVEALTALQNVPRVQPTSARVFFCGYGYAGKTTLQKTMVRSYNNDNFIRKAIHLGYLAEQVKRTSGIEVTCLNTSDVDIFFWDLAEAKECVLLEELSTLVRRSNLGDDIFNITHAWGSMAEATGVGEEYTPIIELVGERCIMGIVSERLVKVEELGKQLGIDRGKASYTWGSESASGINCDILPECSSQSQRIEAKIDVMAMDIKGLDSRLQRIDAKIDVMAMDIKGMKSAIGKLINGMRPEVDRLLTELHNLNLAHDRGGNSALLQFFVLDREKTLLSRLVPGLESSRLTFMCESALNMPHLMLGQEGIAVSTLGEGAVRSILPYMRVMLRVLALGLEVGAPMAQANAIMVPNLSKLIDDLVGKCGGIVERSEMFPGDKCNAYNMQGIDEVVLADARTWVQEFMREKGCDTDSQITKRFGLRKKRLRDGRCVWLCEDHYRHAL